MDRNALAGRTNDGGVLDYLLTFVDSNLGLVEQKIGHFWGRSAPVGGDDHGAFVGVVDLVDCASATSSRVIRLNPWTEGPVCWVLANPRTLPKPVPFRGAQLLFEVPDDAILGTVGSVE